MKLKRLVFTTALIISIACYVNAQAKYDAFLCAFMDGGVQDLRYCISSDGYQFVQVNKGKSILKSTVGGKILRDPQIIKDKNGIYHLITTNAWAGRSFGMWDSKDLIHWVNERVVTVAPENADKTWAPEAIFNEKDNNYLFYWTSSLGNDNSSWSIYYATTSDFKTFSEPAILMRSDQIILDANIVRNSDSSYFMFYRYADQVWRKESDRLPGNYTNPVLIIDANGEGPFVYKVSDKKWNMVWDYYKENGGWYGLAESENLTDWTWLTTKSKPFYTEKVSFPLGVRHGSIISITRSQMRKIQKARFDNDSFKANSGK
jgi:hypothetical protein